MVQFSANLAAQPSKPISQLQTKGQIDQSALAAWRYSGNARWLLIQPEPGYILEVM